MDGFQPSAISVGPKKQNVMKIGQYTKASLCSDRLVGYRLGQVQPCVERKERKADEGVHEKKGGCVWKTVLRKVWLAVVGPRCVFF